MHYLCNVLFDHLRMCNSSKLVPFQNFQSSHAAKPSVHSQPKLYKSFCLHDAHRDRAGRDFRYCLSLFIHWANGTNRVLISTESGEWPPSKKSFMTDMRCCYFFVFACLVPAFSRLIFKFSRTCVQALFALVKIYLNL